jgi:hypothetical protein
MTAVCVALTLLGLGAGFASGWRYKGSLVLAQREHEIETAPVQTNRAWIRKRARRAAIEVARLIAEVTGRPANESMLRDPARRMIQEAFGVRDTDEVIS